MVLDWSNITDINLIDSTKELYVFSGGGYSVQGELPAKKSGFVYIDSSQASFSLNLQIPAIRNGIRGRSHLFNDPRSISSSDWFFNLSATSENLHSLKGGFGMQSSAKLGKDNFDRLNPPIISNYLEIVFPPSRVFLAII